MNENDSQKMYDQMFLEGGYQGIYKLSTEKSWYYPMFKYVAKQVPNEATVLEVGCGNGWMASLLLNKTQYHGFDLSKEAVKMAVQRTNMPELFDVGDALDENNYTTNYSHIVCTEVLEHIKKDLDVIKNWKSGTICICSVPNFDSKWHVRFFLNKEQIVNRYSELLEIIDIKKIRKPVVVRRTFFEYLKYLYRNKSSYKKLLKLLGFCSFDSVGGWYVFTAKRK